MGANCVVFVKTGFQNGVKNKSRGYPGPPALAGLVVGVLYNKCWSIDIRWYILISSDGPRLCCRLRRALFTGYSIWPAQL
jgi:hypothetical protein